MAKSILILSNKSSGSSAVQRLLAQAVNLKCVEKTRHFENESLYWTKAASVLALPQQSMLDSEVPIAQQSAREDLIRLLQDNLPDGDALIDKWRASSTTATDKALIFEGWRQLCKHYEPIFLEKSPHHLLQPSALSLITECIDQLEGEVDFLLVGLVRNPMDTLYSAFRRWKTPPEQLQYEWLKAYTNLRELAEQLGLYAAEESATAPTATESPATQLLQKPRCGRVVIVRYEDLATSLLPLKPVFEFCQTSPSPESRTLNRSSLLKWQQDRRFGFELAPEVKALALAYGYTHDELDNQPWRFWSLYRDFLRVFHQSTRWLKNLYIHMSGIGRA